MATPVGSQYFVLCICIVYCLAFCFVSLIFPTAYIMDSLEAQWKKFSLSEVEGDTADLVSTTDSPKSFLAAKFFTRRVLNLKAVARTFTPLWRTDHGFTIRDMNENILVFVFEDEADRERVMMGEPWAYDKC